MLEIKMFGATTAVTDGGTVTCADMGGVKPRQILEILAVAAGTPVPKDRLAELLWNGEPPKSYVGTLESYVCVLRRSLGLGRGRSSALATTSSGYVLDPMRVRIDLAEFRSLVSRAAVADPATALGLVEEAMTLVQGDLLASEAYTDWATHERELFQQQLIGACTRAAESALAVGNLPAAIRFARLAVTQDPIAEEAWQHLMRALWGSGRRCEALRAYAELRTAMADELGMEPGAASRALYMEILQEGSGRTSATDQHDHTELKTLLDLLRQALDAIPIEQLSRMDGSLTEIATRLVRAA